MPLKKCERAVRDQRSTQQKHDTRRFSQDGTSKMGIVGHVDDFPHEAGRWRELVGVQENDGASVEGLPHKRMFELETWQWVDIWKATGCVDKDKDLPAVAMFQSVISW